MQVYLERFLTRLLVTTDPYAGLTIPVYNHRLLLGSSHHVRPMNLEHAQNEGLCTFCGSDQISFLANICPRYFTLYLKDINQPNTVIRACCSRFFLFVIGTRIVSLGLTDNDVSADHLSTITRSPLVSFHNVLKNVPLIVMATSSA